MKSLKVKNMIEILQAYQEGKTIEYRVQNSDDILFNKWIGVSSVEDLLSELYNGSDVRVKPEPKVRPYKNAQEFLQDLNEHGGWFSFNTEWISPSRAWDNFCCAADSGNYGTTYLYEEMVTAKWLDGHPCGVLLDGQSCDVLTEE